MDQREEQDLIRQSRDGNARAFQALLEAHYTTIFKMAFHLSGHREDAEDITQMACLKISENIQSFRQDSKFTTWIYTIVLNVFRDHIASKAGRRTGNVDIDDVGNSVSANDNPETNARTREQMRLIQSLPTEECEAIVLVFAHGCSHKEAADIAGCAESTISWRIHEARKKLSAMDGGSA